MFGGITKAFSAINPIMSTLQNVSNLVQGLQSGNLGQILSSASQLAMTYATGGAGAMISQAMQVMETINQASQLTSAIANPGADTLSTALTGALGVEAGIGAIAMIGQQMGVPQQTIDAAQAAFAREQGDWGASRENSREAGFGKSMNKGELASARFALDTIRSGGTQQQATIADTVAALLGGANASPIQLGQAQGQVGSFQNAVNNFAFAMFESMLEDMRGNLNSDSNGNRQAGQGAAAGGGAAGAAGAGAAGAGAGAGGVSGGASVEGGSIPSGGGSVLMRIAQALGKAMDDKMNAMAETSDKLGALGTNDELTNDQGMRTAEGDSQYGQLSSQLTAMGQELKIIQESLNNTLKSIGEATSGLARKQ